MQKFLLYENRCVIREHYRKAKKRLLLLDYDGTLVNIARMPAEAKPTAQVYDALNRLAADENNKVALLSGRDSHTLGKWFNIKEITYGAEHGALLKAAGENDWHPVTEFDTSWKTDIQKALSSFVELYPGSFVEEKEYSLVWHYRLSYMENELKEITELCKVLQLLPAAALVYIRQGKKILEIGCQGANKGIAAKMLLSHHNPDFVLAIGDDKTDEDMFSVLRQDKQYTIKVGIEDTRARFCVINPGLVLSLLEFLTG
jgi:trehalose 6-phosphate synthase/phosphatase